MNMDFEVMKCQLGFLKKVFYPDLPELFFCESGPIC